MGGYFLMVAFNKHNSFVEALAEKVHNLGSDTLKVYLTNTAPTAANTVIANITQIANGNGYVTGGNTITTSSSAQTSGVYKLVIADSTFTAAGGTIGPFRYYGLYNSTAVSGELIGFWDYGSALTLQIGEAFTCDFDATNGVIQLT